MNSRIWAGGAALVLALGVVGCSAPTGQEGDDDVVDYPTEDITLVVPYPAGSGPDTWARVMAQGLEEELDVSVIVQNLEGGASTIGLLEVAGEEPDGHTIAVGSFS